MTEQNDATSTIIQFEKHFKKTKKPVWKDLAKILKKSRRQRTSLNIWKLEKLAKKFSGKTLVVPGKILGSGTLTEKIKVYALEYSDSAIKKINSKGQALIISEVVKEKPSTIVIVK